MWFTIWDGLVFELAEWQNYMRDSPVYGADMGRFACSCDNSKNLWSWTSESARGLDCIDIYLSIMWFTIWDGLVFECHESQSTWVRSVQIRLFWWWHRRNAASTTYGRLNKVGSAFIISKTKVHQRNKLHTSQKVLNQIFRWNRRRRIPPPILRKSSKCYNSKSSWSWASGSAETFYRTRI